MLAKLGLLDDVPVCTDLTTKPWLIEAGADVVDRRSTPRGTWPPLGVAWPATTSRRGSSPALPMRRQRAGSSLIDSAALRALRAGGSRIVQGRLIPADTGRVRSERSGVASDRGSAPSGPYALMADADWELPEAGPLEARCTALLLPGAMCSTYAG